MTIHTTHPFADPDPDPVRRLRGRLGGAVTLWTSGAPDARTDWAGLTVSSVMLAAGEPARLVALLDPDSDLAERLEDSGRAVVHVLSWRHRDLAEAFAGLAPAPGGLFRDAGWQATDAGPRLLDVEVWASVTLESAHEVGWSRQVTCVIDEVHLDPEESDDPLLHRRGRYRHG